MPNLFTQAYDKAEEYQGKRLIRLLIVLFFGFLVVGIGVGLLFDFSTGDNSQEAIPIEKTEPGEVSFSGTITYLDPHFYPEDKINFYLSDSKGDQIVLLKSSDQKLEVSEGHFVTVYGYMAKTMKNSEDVLLVDRIVIKNVTD